MCLLRPTERPEEGYRIVPLKIPLRAGSMNVVTSFFLLTFLLLFLLPSFLILTYLIFSNLFLSFLFFSSFCVDCFKDSASAFSPTRDLLAYCNHYCKIKYFLFSLYFFFFQFYFFSFHRIKCDLPTDYNVTF